MQCGHGKMMVLLIIRVVGGINAVNKLKLNSHTKVADSTLKLYPRPLLFTIPNNTK